MYAYHRESGEIAAYGWGKRDLKTARKLWLGVTYDTIAIDDGEGFVTAFQEDNQLIGKKYTVEG
jgi:IS1 family transposase